MTDASTECLLTDLTGPVILPDPPVAVQYLEGYTDLIGDSDPPDEKLMRERFKRAFRSVSVPVNELRYGTTDTEGYWFWKRIVRAVFPRPEAGELESLAKRLYEQFSRADSWRILETFKQSFQEIRERGILTGLITNFDTRGPDLVRVLGIKDLFDVRIFSSEVGLEKPDKRIFREALDRLEQSPERSVMVGDSPEEDLRPAHELGMKTVLFGDNNYSEHDYINDRLSSWEQISDAIA